MLQKGIFPVFRLATIKLTCCMHACIIIVLFFLYCGNMWQRKAELDHVMHKCIVYFVDYSVKEKKNFFNS